MTLYAYAFDSICESCGFTMSGCAALNDPHCLDDVVLPGPPLPILFAPMNITMRNAEDLAGLAGEKSLAAIDLLGTDTEVLEAFTTIQDSVLTPIPHGGGVYSPVMVHAKGNREGAATARLAQSARMKAMQRLLKVFSSQQLAAAFDITPERVWGLAMQRSPEWSARYIEIERAARAGEQCGGRWSREQFTRMRKTCGVGTQRTKWSDAVVQRAADLRATGIGLREVARRLGEEGHPVSRGTVESWFRPGNRKAA